MKKDMSKSPKVNNGGKKAEVKKGIITLLLGVIGIAISVYSGNEIKLGDSDFWMMLVLGVLISIFCFSYSIGAFIGWRNFKDGFLGLWKGLLGLDKKK